MYSYTISIQEVYLQTVSGSNLKSIEDIGGSITQIAARRVHLKLSGQFYYV